MDVDVIVVGSGLAGLTTALTLANTLRVAVVAKRGLAVGASDWAQGGIAAVLDSADSVAAHLDDTMVAGAHLGDRVAIERILASGPAAIRWLIEQGARFTPDPDAEWGYHLTREGGHSQRRIVHAADATGHAVLAALIDQVRRHPRITLLENHLAVSVRTEGSHARQSYRCTGVTIMDAVSRQTRDLQADHVVLACGGVGQVYRLTSNPDTASGDGVVMAWRAGCRVANMEFVQFHPTCLHHPDARSFLISEALRGEGAVLIDAGGRRFMPDYDPRVELAPRDVVARAIHAEMRRMQVDCVFLDISHQPATFIRKHFPSILARCASLDIDITRMPIPVAPAAHYACGGVVTDASARTDVPGLYAVGETAYTGLHGANRLASNSLLECVVMGRAAAAAIIDAHAARGASALLHSAGAGTREGTIDRNGPYGHAPDQRGGPAHGGAYHDAHLDADVARWREAVQQTMSIDVGIVRDDAGLARAAREIANVRERLAAHRHVLMRAPAGLELCNLCDVAALIVASAASRRESRGAHFNTDWPMTQPQGLPTVLTP